MKKVKEKSARRTQTKARPRKHDEHDDFLTDSAHLKRNAPSAQKESLGDRIRKVREMRGLSREDLSSRTGIGLEILEQVEDNRMVPPLGTLIKLGKAVEMKMGYFISPGLEKPMTVVRAECRPTIARYGMRRSEQYGYFYQSLAPEKANRAMEPFLVNLVPSEARELSSHDGQEFIFVLEGKIQARVGEQVETLGPGDSVYYDSGCPHLIKCLGGETAKILAVLYTGAK
jgi:transcriptional regulator with XRE-family HTH domain